MQPVWNCLCLECQAAAWHQQESTSTHAQDIIDGVECPVPSNSIAGVNLRIVSSSINPSQALAGCKGLLTPEQASWHLSKDKCLCGPTQDLPRSPNSLVLHVSIRLRTAIGGSVVVSHLSRAVAPGSFCMQRARMLPAWRKETEARRATASISKNSSYPGKPSIECATYGASKMGDALCMVAHLVGQSPMVVLTYRGHSRATTLH